MGSDRTLHPGGLILSLAVALWALSSVLDGVAASFFAGATRLVGVGGPIDPFGWTLTAAALGALAFAAVRLLDSEGRGRRLAEERAERFAALFEAAPGALVAVDPETGRSVEFNAAAAALAGRSERSFAELDASAWFADRSWEEIQTLLARAAEEGGADFETRLRTADGRGLRALASLRRADADGRALLVCALREAVSEGEADRDAVVGLPGRRRILEQLSALAAFSERRSIPLAAALCDVDGFGAINARHGRAAGDRALAALGDLLRREIRREDTAGRYGDDELCILFPGATAAEAESCIERIRVRMAETIVHGEGGAPFSLRATFGVAEHRPGMSAAELMEAAEGALAEAKSAARDAEKLAA